MGALILFSIYGAKRPGVVVGDRALKLRESMPYEFDLAAAWKEMTGLPFVFAAWVANKKLPEDFISHLTRRTRKASCNSMR